MRYSWQESLACVCFFGDLVRQIDAQVTHRGCAKIIDWLKDQRVKQSIFEAEEALRQEKKE